MPIYEYECPKCGARGEVLQPMDAPPHTCPWCLIDMVRTVSLPARRTDTLDKEGNYVHSKSYKDGYSKEYLKSTGKS